MHKVKDDLPTRGIEYEATIAPKWVRQFTHNSLHIRVTSPYVLSISWSFRPQETLFLMPIPQYTEDKS